ncbi:MAG TPA: peptidyl-prolyl cis-trans isomerase [Burkholderiales bacterium]
MRWLGGLCGALLCLALASAGAAAQVVAARVNGADITAQALERGFEQELRARRLNVARMQRPEQMRGIRREVLDRLIAEELLWQLARRDGRTADDAEVARALEQTMAQFKTRAAFERSISRDGFDEATYREHVRRLLSADRAAQALVEGKLVVTDEEVAGFYQANIAQFRRPEQLRLRVIRIGVPPPGGAPELAGARARIEELRARLVAGEDFDALARRFSEHPTRPWGGALDPVARGQLEAPLEETAFRLQPGEVSAVLEAGAGLHLLRLEERLPAQSVTLEEVRGRIREQLRERRGREVLEREVAALRAASKVEILLPL